MLLNAKFVLFVKVCDEGNLLFSRLRNTPYFLILMNLLVIRRFQLIKEFPCDINVSSHHAQGFMNGAEERYFLTLRQIYEGTRCRECSVEEENIVHNDRDSNLKII